MPPGTLHSPSSKKRILFIHPDLGIGGAERLVVDAAVGLQDRGHEVTIYTSHCDPHHCFDEARNGTLKVRVAGDKFIPPNIFGRFSILCAILRQLHLTATLIRSGELKKYDCIFIDQLSASIPLYRLIAPHIVVLFYCHFPDYLLASRTSCIKSLYRILFDWIEGWTTGQAHTIVVNSKFTKSVFAGAFPKIRTTPRVVYPCVDVKALENESGTRLEGEIFLMDGRRILLSINRFERKKNIELAIEAFSRLRPDERAQLRLVIAGGYDNRVTENVSYHNDLIALCESQKLRHITCKNFITALSIPAETDVLFLLSIPSKLKTSLLKTSSLLLYTPENEHFGIVPLEAMLAQLPVLAHNSGGPLETIQDGVTGWLRPESAEEWSDTIRTALFDLSPEQRRRMGEEGQRTVLAQFTKEKMAERLEDEFSIEPKNDRLGALTALLALSGLAICFLGIGIALL